MCEYFWFVSVNGTQLIFLWNFIIQYVPLQFMHQYMHDLTIVPKVPKPINVSYIKKQIELLELKKQLTTPACAKWGFFKYWYHGDSLDIIKGFPLIHVGALFYILQIVSQRSTLYFLFSSFIMHTLIYTAGII